MRRDEFLERVRRSSAGVAQPYSRPLPLLADVPEVRYATADLDLVEVFVERARRAGCLVHERTDPAELVEALAADHRRVLLGPEPEVASLGDVVAGRTVHWPECGVEVAAAADMSVSGCRWAIAETGSVALSSLEQGGRSAGLLSATHVALVAKQRIVPTPGSVIRRLGAEALPSCLVLMTGPSRTADIEHKLTIGVHGPAELHVVLIDGP